MTAEAKAASRIERLQSRLDIQLLLFIAHRQSAIEMNKELCMPHTISE
jgi:hypothetical protein